ncbi:thioredoxin domain-containing protein [Noviherbaspirillum galbum]|uniref:Redoxin domain-containing protein n=1 Tax=Noviherbaspirillum galbum TaxID=2709383 RepID=A0A6B3SH64_9BURK|nr:redoxin domain-containing protein [Noviherbaspirillum galbum]NEX59998.1 redoxin domain-containing protein [Noviherbaspirillum galbum]
MKAFAFAALVTITAMAAPCLAAEPVHEFGPESLGKIKEAHAGKPLVIMIWSLDCAYCLESFQALEQGRRGQGLDIVTISTDQADDAETVKQIRKKIGAAGLHAETWAFGNASAEQLRFAIDPKWRGELPRTYWFPRDAPPSAYSGLVTKDLIARRMTSK